MIGTFVFLVALKPRSAATDWKAVQASLRTTVLSARASGEAHGAAVVVACHDEPALGDASGRSVQLLRVPFPEPTDLLDGARDKARKRRFAAAWARDRMTEENLYVMFLDADDLVHRNLVGHVLASGRASHLVTSGYVVDVARGVVFRMTSGFHRSCGSSFVSRFARDELPESDDDLAALFSRFGAPPEQRGHEHYHEIAAELGRPAIPVPFGAVAYVVNHGQNLWSVRREGRLRPPPHPRTIMSPAAARHLVSDDFTAPGLARELSGYRGVGLAFLASSRIALGARLRRRRTPD